MKSSSVQTLIQRHGVEAAETHFAFVQKQLSAFKQIVETERLDCEFELRRSYDVYLNEDEAKLARKQYEQSLRDGQKWTEAVQMLDCAMAEQVRIASSLQYRNGSC